MNFTVTVHAESLIAKMAGAPDELRRRLKIVVDRLSIQVQSAVKFNKLSGQVLHVRTNALRGRIGRDVEDRADGVFTQIWISESTPYGAAWEHGFTRKVGAGARGGAKSLRGMARERYMAKHPPGKVSVAARPFLRPTLKEFEPRIRRDLREAVMGVVR